MKEQPHHPRIEPELEARIVALVLGEASDFERAELERLIEERLELAVLKKRIEAVHGLLSEVAVGELVGADEDWKLSAEKRSAVLAVMGGEAQVKLARKAVQEPVENRKSVSGIFFWNFGKIAAVLCVMGFVAGTAMLKLQNPASIDATRMRQLASSRATTPGPQQDASGPFSGSESARAAAIKLKAQIAAQVAVGERFHSKVLHTAAAAVDGHDRKAESKSAHPSTNGDAGRSFPEPADRSGSQIASALAEPELGITNSRDGRLSTEELIRAQAKSPQFSDSLEEGEISAQPDDNFDADGRRLGRVGGGGSGGLGGGGGFGGKMLADQGRKGISAPRQPAHDEWYQQAGRPGTVSQGPTLMVTPRIIVEKSLPAKKTPVKQLAVPAGLNEKTAEEEAFSTFSLHVSDVSFRLAQAALAKGEWPEASKIRIEEFVNAFDYGDPIPSQSEKVACRLEQTIHPFLQQRNLLRVSMRTAAAGRSDDTPLRLTFLLDNSGSMERSDRQETVRRAFALLAQQLKPIDQVTLISFARQPRLLADQVSGAQSDQWVQLINNLPSEGGTNIEAALQLAFEKAQEQQVDHGQNRIVMLTDGAANLGDANPDSLSRMIETMRDAGLAFDAAGISAEGLNDEILEALTRKGDGRYYLLDQPDAADDGFAHQIAGALRPAAKNVKVQIEFNPKRVGRYKLLGFEKHRLKKEDFRNDQVDAAEMAAAEAGVAVYQFEAKADGEGDVGSVSVRFRDMSTGQMVENRWPIPYEVDAAPPDQAAPSVRIAASAALFAAKLRGEPLGETVDLTTLSNLIARLPDRYRSAKRIQQLQQMIHQARQVSGE